ncbi:hypothetical protein EVAR_37615_1 [Eumeta japonica]|uniref:Uncharacterized protein n=1 Tax=Eumeta variegata TaxID=151549 RepID=A0A4C1VQV2_EUMVA|nr:hypothetical protein EVAR_37615_1 [Eumeta japonica]
MDLKNVSFLFYPLRGAVVKVLWKQREKRKFSDIVKSTSTLEYKIKEFRLRATDERCRQYDDISHTEGLMCSERHAVRRSYVTEVSQPALATRPSTPSGRGPY